MLYCTDVLLYREGGAPKMIEVYDAVSPALPVFGGLLADTLCRRYSVIVSGAFITLFGKYLFNVFSFVCFLLFFFFFVLCFCLVFLFVFPVTKMQHVLFTVSKSSTSF